jgi:TniQ
VTTPRWPLHTAPAVGEALSSWLLRMAAVYGMSVEQLVRHNLGDASFELVDRNDGTLDRDPPPGVLDALHERTGVPHEQLREMTIAGWVPWLLDTLDPALGAEAFDTYVQGDSVLLNPGEAVSRHLPGWRAWLPAEPMRRACPRCMDGIDGIDGQAPVFTLVSQIPLTISCPVHGYRLEATFGSLGTFIAWQDPDMAPAPVDPRVTVMDRRTHEGLSTGTVALPGRPVHVGVWLRLLRTLLDELNTPTSYVRVSSRTTLQRIWQVTGHPARAGQILWRPYEALSWPTQQAMLHAAAVALNLIETGQITARGSLGPALRDGPHQPVHDGDPRQKTLAELFDEALASARTKPDEARTLLHWMTVRCRTEAEFVQSRKILTECEIPDAFLPRWQEWLDTRHPSVRP